MEKIKKKLNTTEGSCDCMKGDQNPWKLSGHVFLFMSTNCCTGRFISLFNNHQKCTPESLMLIYVKNISHKS